MVDPREPSPATFAAEVWEGARVRTTAVCSEILVGSAFIFGLIVWFLGIRILAAVEFPPTWVQYLEDIHFCADLAVLLALLLDFVKKAWASTLKPE